LIDPRATRLYIYVPKIVNPVPGERHNAASSRGVHRWVIFKANFHGGKNVEIIKAEQIIA
jgi:hypothetical protein